MKGPVRISTVDELTRLVGTEVGCSAWRSIDQSMVDGFAEVTGDQNPIHVDPKSTEAARFAGTIAHGFLTLSLIATMAYESCPAIAGTGTTVNYGFERVRFVAAVRVGSRVRGRFKLLAFDVKASGRWQARYEVTVEIGGSEAPAIVCVWITAGIP